MYQGYVNPLVGCPKWLRKTHCRWLEGSYLEDIHPFLGERFHVATNDLARARVALHRHFEEVDRQSIKDLSRETWRPQREAFEDQGSSLMQRIQANNDEIRKLEEQRRNLERHRVVDVAGAIQDELADTVGIPRVPGGPDCWTSIFVEISAGGFHQEYHSAASREMANALVKISFECMRVDIIRPWLRGRLFQDHELRVPKGC